MEKVLYWLKKLGILRTSSYAVKGDAEKINEMNATDGGMIQSQGQIDSEHAKKTGEDPKPEEPKKAGVLFWIFLIVALFFLVAFLSIGLSFGSFVAIVLWAVFLFFVKQGSASWAVSFVKVLMIGLVLVVFSLVVTPSEEGADLAVTGDVTVETGETEELVVSCDDSNSDNRSFYEVEETIVSMNPCEVPWILGKTVDSYTLTTAEGTELQVNVIQHYVNNVKPDESYTIRVLDADVEDPNNRADVERKEMNTSIAIVRWTPNKASLPDAKREVAETVKELDF
jgi:cell division protein FtsW (lipid II flippase)